MMAACTNEDVVNSNGVDGKMMDATNFSLVGVKGGESVQSRASYLPQYVYLDGSSLKAGVVKPVWEADDQVGFTHIYPSDQKIVTNYKFEIEAAGVGTSNAATFKTTNSTIFAGDYFVYYPYNDEYCDYDGIPFELDAIQTQNASADAIVKVGDITAPLDASEIDMLTKAGAHVSKYRFSIANRIEAVAATDQANFALNQYTSTLAFLIYPKAQTETIHIQRIEMVAKSGKTLEVPTKVLFNAVAGQAAPVATVDKKVNKAVLLFDNVSDGGLAIKKDGTKETATLAYMCMIPNTYAKEDFEFIVYYSENNIMKKRVVETYKDLTLTSNSTTFFNIELDANKAEQVVNNEIWSETEFASAVAKSNAVTNGAVEYTIMQNIDLKNDYELNSAVPVTFKGGKTITLAAGKELKLNSSQKIEINNTIAGGENAQTADLWVEKGEVEIDAVNSQYLLLTNKGTTTILNEELTSKGKLGLVNNYNTLTLSNVAVAGHVMNGYNEEEATLDLSHATVGNSLYQNAVGEMKLEDVDVTGNVENTKGDMEILDVTATGNFNNTEGDLVAKDLTVGGNYTSFASAQTIAAEMENVIVNGYFAQSGGDLNLTGTNVLAYNATTDAKTNFFSYSNKVNVTNSTTTIGNLGESKLYLAEGSEDAVVFTVKGTSTLTNSFVLVDANATYNAEGAVTGLKGNGNPAESTMCLEGKLTTNGVVTLADDFSICGTIENKANGLWTVNSSMGVLKFNHSHTTEPEFINGGKVVVEGILTTAEVNSIAKVKMAKDLYSAESTGILEWKGMQNLANVNAIYALGADCYATDLYAQLATNTEETLASDLNWSAKNIILHAVNAYKGRFAATKKLSAKNLTVYVDNKNLEIVGGTTDKAAGKYVVNVTETLTLNKLAASTQDTQIDLTSSICQDIKVDNSSSSNTHTIKNGINMNYTGSYTTTGAVEKTSYPNNIPQKK